MFAGTLRLSTTDEPLKAWVRVGTFHSLYLAFVNTAIDDRQRYGPCNHHSNTRDGSNVTTYLVGRMVKARIDESQIGPCNSM